jgi:iron complex outermembrane receptor protein
MSFRVLSARRLLAGAATVLCCSIVLADENEDAPPADPPKPVVHGSLEVTATAIPIPAVTVIEREAVRSTVPQGDGSEVLRDVTGADLSRMGGHGLEPFVRGQSRGDLTVLLDGASIHGGCPNRMDPSTAYSATETTDRVVVIRGVQTLRYGPGAPGGTVLYDRQVPDFDDTRWSAEIGGGGSTWMNVPEFALDAALGFDDWSLRALASFRDLGNYEDGDGAEVRSAAKSSSAMLMAGWRPGETMVELSYEYSNTEDALFAGAGMDAPESTAVTLRLQTERAAGDGRVGWRLDAFSNSVDHLMDNYSLRPLRAPMALEVPSETSTWGLRGHLETAGRLPFIIGLTVEEADADATRFGGPTPETIAMVQSIMWPDVRRRQTGAFVEGVGRLGEAMRLVYGLRVDHFTADAGRADEPTMGGNGPSPRQLWSRYYGDDEASWSDTALGGLVRFEHGLGAWSYQVGLSRTLRVADATERYLGANSSMAPMRWVGNPGLDPARFHQFDLGAGWRGGGAQANLTLFAADVENLILSDRAHGQEGVLLSDNARVYRNVDALRYGGELDAAYRGSGSLVVSGGLWWVWASNTTDDRPIAQTPPLTGRVSVAWSPSRWSVSATGRFAAEQDRVDDDPSTGSGLDAGPTPGWAILDLAASVTLGAGFGLSAGVANVLDRTYANHLNRGSLFDPDPVRVNEPGRTLWLRLKWVGGG